MNAIDSIVRHITKPNDNIFLDLGFSPEEAERYLAESRKKLEEELNIKKKIGNDVLYEPPEI